MKPLLKLLLLFQSKDFSSNRLRANECLTNELADSIYNLSLSIEPQIWICHLQE